jgi:hypothetical protein
LDHTVFATAARLTMEERCVIVWPLRASLAHGLDKPLGFAVHA